MRNPKVRVRVAGKWKTVRRDESEIAPWIDWRRDVAARRDAAKVWGRLCEVYDRWNADRVSRDLQFETLLIDRLAAWGLIVATGDPEFALVAIQRIREDVRSMELIAHRRLWRERPDDYPDGIPS